MDVQVHNNRTVHYGLNNYQNTRTVKDDLQFLSLEERECIMFFEETIDSLDEELDDKGAGIAARSHTPAEMLRAPAKARLHSAGHHDIIDLVHPTPKPNKHTDTLPDFQMLVKAPETHFEMKANRDPMVNFPPEEGAHHPPPGSVPTPVIIASKIAEHQGTGGGLAVPSVQIQRSSSLELPQNPMTKHAPPTHAKPMNLPDNISFMLGSREHIPHSIATEAVSVHERRAQMLANLPGSAHPLEGGEPACVRKNPMRRMSFRDPTPDQSRNEALSKLGLVRNRAQSAIQPSLGHSIAEGISYKTSTNTVQKTLKSDNVPMHTYNTSSSVHAPNVAKTSNTSKSLNAPNMANTANTANTTTNKASTRKVTSTANMTNGLDTTDHYQTSTVTKQVKPSPSSALTNTEVIHSDFNSYGGKSITLNPTMSTRAEYAPPQSATATSSPKKEAPEVQLNSFGGLSRVMNPSVVHRDEPDLGNSSYSHSPPSQSHISHLNAYGARSKTFSPVKEDNSAVSSHPASRTADRVVPTRKMTSSPSKAPPQPVVTRQPPTPAPKPPHQSSPLSPTRTRTSPLSPTRTRTSPPSSELRHKPTPKPSFRAQGITVQFSGKGNTDEARRDALRKLGVLRDTS